MNRFRKQITTLLKEHGAKLVRQKNHKVFKLDNGKIYTESTTPSTQLGDRRTLADLRRVLPKEPKAVPETTPAKLPRKPRPGRVEPIKYDKIESASASFADKLKLSGVVEIQLRDEIAMNLEHIAYLENQIAIFQNNLLHQIETAQKLQQRVSELETRRCMSWYCRLKSRLTGWSLSELS